MAWSAQQSAPNELLVTLWLKRLLYLFLFLLWVLVMAFPLGAALLASNGQIQLGGEDAANQVRIFLVQEREQEGIGVEWRRSMRDDGCRQGSISYVMWKGTAENARYCTCFDANGDVLRSQPGACPGN